MVNVSVTSAHPPRHQVLVLYSILEDLIWCKDAEGLRYICHQVAVAAAAWNGLLVGVDAVVTHDADDAACFVLAVVVTVYAFPALSSVVLLYRPSQ